MMLNDSFMKQPMGYSMMGAPVQENLVISPMGGLKNSLNFDNDEGTDELPVQRDLF